MDTPTITNVTASDSSFTIEWDAVTDATYYQVEYRFEVHPEWFQSDWVPAPATSFVLKNLDHETSYCLRLRVRGVREWSEYSATAINVTDPAPIQSTRP